MRRRTGVRTGVRGGIEERREAGVRLLRLRAGESTADIAPELGMCVVSWCVDGTERLKLPADLASFAASMKTGGVPLLYPWANRLRADSYVWRGVSGSVAEMPGLKRDANALPIHGALVRWAKWSAVVASSGRFGAKVEAGLGWDESLACFAAFPFDHRLDLCYQLTARELTITTSLQAGERDVPVAFGWHPYLALNAPRDSCVLSLPPRERVALDDRMLPKRLFGEPGVPLEGQLDVGPVQSASCAPLGSRTFDDLFRVGGRSTVRIGDVALELRGGYRFLQLYAPYRSDYVCIEPMVAPAAALCDGNDLGLAAACTQSRAEFALRVR